VVFVFGLTIGSFLNVCIYRLPREMSLVTPRSHCFHCHTELTAADLVPLVSFLLLRGRCRACGVRFSAQYFWVELATGLILAGLFARHGPTVDFVAQALFACVLIPIFVIDLRHYLIPNELNAVGVLIGLAADGIRIAQDPTALLEVPVPGTAWFLLIPRSVAGLLVGGGVFLLVVVVGTALFHREAMGGGDVKLAAAAGAHFGPGYAFLTFFLLSILLGAVVGVGLIVSRRRSRRDYIPFGPFMVVSALLLMLGPASLVRSVQGVYSLGP